jgi:hypothetical protein
MVSLENPLKSICPKFCRELQLKLKRIQSKICGIECMSILVKLRAKRDPASRELSSILENISLFVDRRKPEIESQINLSGKMRIFSLFRKSEKKVGE